MPIIMYDSTNPFAIPENAEAVLVYTDGIYKWSQAGRDRFKDKIQVTCSAVGAVTAHVGDVESGCIWPVEKAPGWVQRARADGYDPTVYINELNDWGPCRAAFHRAGVAEPHWLVANYNGVKLIPAGSIGRQYAHSSVPLGNPNNVPWHTKGHWDESIVDEEWLTKITGESAMSEEVVRNGLAGWLKYDLAQGSDQRALLQALLAETEIEIKDEDGTVLWGDQIGAVVAAIDRRLVRVEQKAVADVDESALADELAKRGVGGTDPAAVKAALSEVLRSTRFEPNSAG